MANRIYRLDDDNPNLLPMEETQYDSEKLLQELLAKYPDLLAGEQIDIDDPRRWLLITREMSVPGDQVGAGKWSLDHLFLDQDAIPTLVEVKKSANTDIRRKVIGQMLDYAANGVAYWTAETLQKKFLSRCQKESVDPDIALAELLGDEESQELADFWNKVSINLQDGRIRMVFIADVIPTELRRIVEFLNDQMEAAEVLAIEVKQFVGDGIKTLVPRVLGQTEAARQKKSAHPGSGKDYTKLDVAIDGNLGPPLPKRTAMLRVVKHLCNNGVTPEQIGQCVPGKAQMFCSVLGDVTSDEFVKNAKVSSGGVLRYFCNDDQLIKSNGQTYALINQWGPQTITAIQDILATFPDKGVQCEKHQG